MCHMTTFEQLSKQRIDYTTLPNGGQRARMTVTLPPMPGYPKGRSLVFVEDITPNDVKQYATQIAGVEIGCAMALGPVSGVEVGNIFRNVSSAAMGAGNAEIGSFLGDIAKGLGGAVKAVGKVAKKVVTSKVMQTAAKGLALAAPALGPFAPAAMGVSAGIGIAGKLLASKTAASVNAPLASNQLAQSAVADAKRLTTTAGGLSGLLKSASQKAMNAFKLVDNVVATGKGDVMAMARLGKVRSNQGGAVTPAQLTSAAGAGRLFFIAA
jgi:hypothetical protein